MLTLEDLGGGMVVDGIVDGSVTLLAVERLDENAVTATYRGQDGALGDVMLFRADQGRLSLAGGAREWT